MYNTRYNFMLLYYACSVLLLKYEEKGDSIKEKIYYISYIHVMVHEHNMHTRYT